MKSKYKNNRVKYDPSLKSLIVEEYMRGSSAKEISQKYGVKQRTIYDWCSRARNGELLNDLERKNVNFLESNSESSSKQDPYYEEKFKSLEKRVIELEKIIKYKK